MFDAFREVSDGHGRQHEGNGLGLTIARRLTELMGGTLRAENELGSGSRFQTLLPATQPGAVPTLAQIAAASA